MLLNLNELINSTFLCNFARMKHPKRIILVIATLGILLLTCYQAYWLILIYKEQTVTLHKEIQESVRAADFEELVHRVMVMRQQKQKADITVAVDVDKNRNEITTTEESRYNQDEQLSEDYDTADANQDFSDALKNSEDVYNVGLSVQRGMHVGLDRIRPVDAVYFDKALTKRLDSLGITIPHETLFLSKRLYKGKTVTDTLKRIGNINNAECVEYAIDIDHTSSRSYLIKIPKYNSTVLRRIMSPILFSVVTFLFILIAFSYSLNVIKKMKALDEMKSDFTNNITHELKTPIAVAYSAIDALLNFNGENNPEKVHKYLTICQQQLTMLTQLIEQILSLSMERRQHMSLNIEQVEVMPVVKELINNQRLKQEKHIDFQVEIPAGITVTADKMHFSNILNNLIDNAVKYSGDNLKIYIKAKREKNCCVITVVDNGIGISSDNQKYIFNKFYRVPQGNLHPVKGYGLGLFYVKSMMDKFKGEISVNSELGKGTTFKLKFNGKD